MSNTENIGALLERISRLEELVERLQSKPQPTTAIAEAMTVKECAAFLGRPVPSIYWLARMGKLPHFRIGSAYRFEREKIQRMCRSKGGAR
jgi:excisionase family DNA binding protein